MNQLQIIGNLTRDAEVKQSQQGDNYLQFAIAVNEGKDKAMFVNVRQKQYSTAPNGLLLYLLKGKKVFVQGRLTVNVYQSKQNGGWLPDITLWADRIELCGSNDNGTNQQPQGAPQAPQVQQQGNVIYPSQLQGLPSQESTTDLPF